MILHEASCSDVRTLYWVLWGICMIAIITTTYFMRLSNKRVGELSKKYDMVMKRIKAL